MSQHRLKIIVLSLCMSGDEEACDFYTSLNDLVLKTKQQNLPDGISAAPYSQNFIFLDHLKIVTPNLFKQ